MRCTKAIIPVAGYGTRRFPVTKTIEKCMLPIVNRPVIDYVVEDCVKAGITDIYFVVSEESTQLHDYYQQKPRVEAYLRTNGKEALIPLVQPPQDVRFHFVTQDTSPNALFGTAIPVWLCREYVEPGEHVLVLMGDDFIFRTDGQSEAARLMATVATDGGSALLAAEVDPSQVSSYGVIAMKEVDGANIFSHIQEKPRPEEAESNLINISKYLFEARFFTYLEQSIQQHTGKGEYYITDALNAYVEAGNRTYVLPAEGQYLDSGTVENWIKANQVVFAAEQAKEGHGS